MATVEDLIKKKLDDSFREGKKVGINLMAIAALEEGVLSDVVVKAKKRALKEVL